MSALWLKLAPYLIVLVGGLVMGSGLTHLIDDKRRASVQADFNEFRRVTAEEKSIAAADTLARQNAQISRIQDIQNESSARIAANDRLVADMRERYSRLRIATTCPAHSPVSGSTHPSERVEAPTERVILEADGRGFIGIGADAEDTRQTLLVCQATLKSIQQVAR
jgi:hypothetical protein